MYMYVFALFALFTHQGTEQTFVNTDKGCTTRAWWLPCSKYTPTLSHAKKASQTSNTDQAHSPQETKENEQTASHLIPLILLSSSSHMKYIWIILIMIPWHSCLPKEQPFPPPYPGWFWSHFTWQYMLLASTCHNSRQNIRQQNKTKSRETLTRRTEKAITCSLLWGRIFWKYWKTFQVLNHKTTFHWRQQVWHGEAESLLTKGQNRKHEKLFLYI